MREEDVRAVLDRAVPELPPSRVDPALAIRAGLRHRRRRALAVTGAAVAVPVVLAAAVLTAGRGGLAGPARPGPLTPAGPTSAGPTSAGPTPAGPTPATSAPATATGTGPTGPAVRVAPRSFDPLRLTLAVGWHPAAFTDRTEQTGTDRQAVSFVPPGPVGGSGAYVSVLTARRTFGDEHSFGMEGVEPIDRPTAPVRGGPAICLTDACGSLRWQYAPGAWAWVSYSGGVGEDPAVVAATARRIAESVTLTDGRPVRMPFRITGATARLAVTSTLVQLHSAGRTGDLGEHWNVDLTLNTPGSRQPPDTYGEPGGISLGVLDRPAAAGVLPDGRDAVANTTIGGLPAAVNAAGTNLVRWGVRGTRIYVEVNEGPWRARAVDADLRLVADPADTATWVVPLG